MKTMKVRRGRGRPPKSSYINNNNNNNVKQQPLISFNFPRKQRTKTKTAPIPTFVAAPDLEALPQQPQQIVGALQKSFDVAKTQKQSFNYTPSPPSDGSLDSSTTLFYIPGPIPDLDALLNDSSLYVNFFENIPDEFED
ncbi:hypothetical protein FNV43_RR16497 [Rhamnella rubrinervis]|uniref:Uncharacterized protein n=1 Tax=Rhamnella rubrinervis TaxID=2594499 RepID=A0A8K0MDA6_9ROSA|nr:hypothetical protein FNV43_RR16497 [Rhamnella rubrinervis]